MATLDDLAKDWFTGQNFLGRPSSLRLTGDTPGDQSTGGILDAGTPAPPVAGGVGPTGAGGVGPASATSTDNAATTGVMPGESLSPILRALIGAQQALGKGQQIASFFPSGAPGSFARPAGLEEAWQAFRAGERGDLASLLGFGSPEVLGQVSGGELALGAEAAGLGAEAAGLGSDVAGLASEGFAGLTQAMPIFNAMVGLIRAFQGHVPLEGLINMIAPGFRGPSQDWRSFPARLSQTLHSEARASDDLAQALLTAQPGDVANLVAQWRQSVGIPGFAADVTDPYLISPLPGAGGR